MVLKSSLTGILTQKLVCCFQIHLLTHYYFNTVSMRDLIKAECDFIYNRNWNRAGFAHTLTAWQSYSPRGVCLGSLPRQTEGQRTSSHPPGIPTPGCLWTHNGPSICCCGAKVQGRQLWSASSFFCVLPGLVTVDRLCSVFWLCLFVSSDAVSVSCATSVSPQGPSLLCLEMSLSSGIGLNVLGFCWRASLDCH